jgi:hypothetical protein
LTGWYLGTAPIITADWKAPKGDRWVVPVGGGVGRICRLGTVPLNTQAFFLLVQCVRRAPALKHASPSRAVVSKEAAMKRSRWVLYRRFTTFYARTQKEIAKVFVVAVIINLIYEIIVVQAIYLRQSLIEAVAVALVPMS